MAFIYRNFWNAGFGYDRAQRAWAGRPCHGDAVKSVNLFLRDALERIARHCTQHLSTAATDATDAASDN